MIRRNKDTEKEYSKKKKTETSGIKEVKDIKEKLKAIKAGIKELKEESCAAGTKNGCAAYFIKF